MCLLIFCTRVIQRDQFFYTFQSFYDIHISIKLLSQNTVSSLFIIINKHILLSLISLSICVL